MLISALVLQVAGISWLERKGAAALYAMPPESSFDEALQNFMKVCYTGGQFLTGMSGHYCLSHLSITDTMFPPPSLPHYRLKKYNQISGKLTCS